MSRGVFVTGTDTGVGKTLAACALLHALRARGIAAFPMKPVAAGAVERDGRWINDDTHAMLRAAGLGLDLADAVTPVLLREPMAPHIAARREGRDISVDAVARAFRALSAAHPFIVVEGVGGFRVPLGDHADTVDLAKALALPVVLVVGMRLGCLNHALLTAQAIAAAGLRLAGWIASDVDPAMAVADENVAALRSRLPAPLIARLPHARCPDPAVLAARIDPQPLLA